jgi:hypothetical protein
VRCERGWNRCTNRPAAGTSEEEGRSKLGESATFELEKGLSLLQYNCEYSRLQTGQQFLPGRHLRRFVSFRSFAPLLALSSCDTSTATHRTPSLLHSYSLSLPARPFSSSLSPISTSGFLLHLFSFSSYTFSSSFPFLHPSPCTGQHSTSRATREPALRLPRLLNCPRPFSRRAMEDHQLPSPAGTQLLVDVRGAEIVSSHSEECVFFLLTLFFLP